MTRYKRLLAIILVSALMFSPVAYAAQDNKDIGKGLLASLEDSLSALKGFAEDPVGYFSDSLKRHAYDALGMDQADGHVIKEGNVFYYFVALAVATDTTDFEAKMEPAYNKARKYAIFFWALMVLLWFFAYTSSINQPARQGEVKNYGLDLITAFLLLYVGLYLYSLLIEVNNVLTLELVGSVGHIPQMFASSFLGATQTLLFIVLGMPFLLTLAIFSYLHRLIVYMGAIMVPLIIVGYYSPMRSVKGFSKFLGTLAVFNIFVPFFYAALLKSFSFVVGVFSFSGLFSLPLLIISYLVLVVGLFVFVVLAVLSTSVGRIGAGAGASVATGNPAPLMVAVGGTAGRMGWSMHGSGRSRFARRPYDESQYRYMGEKSLEREDDYSYA